MCICCFITISEVNCFKNTKKEYSEELHSVIFDGCILSEIMLPWKKMLATPLLHILFYSLTYQ